MLLKERLSIGPIPRCEHKERRASNHFFPGTDTETPGQDPQLLVTLISISCYRNSSNGLLFYSTPELYLVDINRDCSCVL